MGKGTFVPTEAPALVPSTDWHGDLQLLATLVLGDHALLVSRALGTYMYVHRTLIHLK